MFERCHEGVWMMPPERDEFITETARYLVGEVAPDELPVFPATATRFLRSPRGVLRDRRRSGDFLGSGLDTVVDLVTPVALMLAAGAYQGLIGRAGEVVAQKGLHQVARLLGRRKSVPPTSRTVSEAQLTALRERAIGMGLSDEQVDLLLAALARKLDTPEATTTSEPPAPAVEADERGGQDDT
ncbi:MAG TPA: hypothetical protein VGN81_15700 [Pseudonocardiaceae bacterium]|jgi:hypothetical protein